MDSSLSSSSGSEENKFAGEQSAKKAREKGPTAPVLLTSPCVVEIQTEKAQDVLFSQGCHQDMMVVDNTSQEYPQDVMDVDDSGSDDQDAVQQAARKERGKSRAAPDIEVIQEDPENVMVVDDTSQEHPPDMMVVDDTESDEENAIRQATKKEKGKSRGAPDVKLIQEDPQDIVVIDDTESDEEDSHNLTAELEARFGPATSTADEAIKAIRHAEDASKESQGDIIAALRIMQQQDRERLEHARRQERERLAQTTQQHVPKESEGQASHPRQSLQEHVNLVQDHENIRVRSDHAPPGLKESSQDTGIPLPGIAMGPPPIPTKVRERQLAQNEPDQREPDQREPETQGGQVPTALSLDRTSYKDAEKFLKLHIGSKLFAAACVTCQNWLVVVTKRTDLPSSISKALIKNNGFVAALCHRCEKEQLKDVGLGLTMLNKVPPTLSNEIIEDWRMGKTIRTCLHLTMTRRVPYRLVLWSEIKSNIQDGDTTFVGNEYRTGFHADVWFFPGVPNGFL